MISFWEKLLRIDKRIIYVFMLLAMTMPLFVTFGLPISVSSQVREVYEQVEALNEGAIVWIGFEVNPPQEPEMAPMLRSLVRHLLQRKARIVIGGFMPQGATLAAKYSLNTSGEIGHLRR